MRLVAVAVRILLLGTAVLVMGCSDTEEQPGASRPGAAPPYSARPPVQAQPPRLPARPGLATTVDPADVPEGKLVEPESGLLDLRRIPWQRIEARPGRDSVVVHYSGGIEACYGLARVDVGTRGSRPVITVYEGLRPEARGRLCAEIAVFKRVVVPTSEPIDPDRVLGGA